MNKTQIILVGAVFFVVIAGAAFFYSPVPKTDLGFAQMVFKGLLAGNVRMAEHIDWPSVKMMGYDVAAAQAAYTDTDEKESFKKALIKNIARSFGQTGGKIKDFTNWRVHEVNQEAAVLAADYDTKDAVILVKVIRVNGDRKLNGLEWLAIPGDAAAPAVPTSQAGQNEESQ